MEYARLRAFEQYLNRNAASGKPSPSRSFPRLGPVARTRSAAKGSGCARGAASTERYEGHQPQPTGGQRRCPGAGQPPGWARYQRLEQLSGRSLALPPGSAAGPALAQLNKQLMERKLAPLSPSGSTRRWRWRMCWRWCRPGSAGDGRRADHRPALGQGHAELRIEQHLSLARRPACTGSCARPACSGPVPIGF